VFPGIGKSAGKDVKAYTRQSKKIGDPAPREAKDIIAALPEKGEKRLRKKMRALQSARSAFFNKGSTARRRQTAMPYIKAGRL
jgi:hypothetical protein